MFCGNCQSFLGSKKCIADEDSEEEGKFRNCRVGGQKVTSRSTSCNEFKLKHTFFCQRHDQSYDVLMCLARQKKNHPGCSVRCQQGKMFKRYTEYQKGAGDNANRYE